MKIYIEFWLQTWIFKDVELHQIVKNVEKEILDTGFWI